MQISAFRGSRTVTSLRLCSRAPWTTSSSAAIGPLSYRSNMRSPSVARPQDGQARYTVVETARRAFIATTVALLVILTAMALWKVKLVIALLFLALTISAAMRPGVEWLQER